MAMEITGNYSGYAAQNMTGSNKADDTKKKSTEQTAEKYGNNRMESTADYMSKLEKLAPSVEFAIGNTHSSAKSGKTLTINPALLKKMQDNPDKEKEMKELIRGVESATKLLDSMHRASGWTVVYRHGYIDENGKYSSCAYVRNDFMSNMSDKLREERKENAEKRIEKSREKARENAEQLAEKLGEKAEKAKESEKSEERNAIKEGGTAIPSRAEQLLEEKMAASKDGMIYLYDTDMKMLMEAAKENTEGRKIEKEYTKAGVYLDLKV